MRLIARLIVAVIANAAGLLAAQYFIPGFTLTPGLKEILLVALLLTAINVFLKHAIKLLLGPVIVLTFGLGLLAVNILLLKFLDLLSDSLTIHTVPALIFASLLIGAVNFVFHLATKK